MSARKRTNILATLVIAFALVAAPAAANATSWGWLTVYDGGTMRGQAKGTGSVTTTSLKNVSTYFGTPYAGTRVETTWRYYLCEPDVSGKIVCGWTTDSRSDSPTWNSTSLTTYTAYNALDQSASQGRIQPRICVPKPWGVPVPCSNTAIMTFSY